ncbi:hypothetical protein Nocox_19235 [Nonomuraea coxensis DSM 45129]|uniref:Uncharacterized protein n=1 Tax=Nonomuraea coxensis DSM 45129 TaxID=1122611 RepID=A0ABX8U1W8_9ACTN|nr:hypothetical protein [Nonomuraea coxensis]QYC41456.1 hypothetical protein Nocox_19235 [Nonomuraea coxensis DSM 45129]
MRADITWTGVGADTAAAWGGAGIPVAGTPVAGVVALAVCAVATFAIGWRSRAHAARQEHARRATQDLIAAVGDLRADLQAATTSAERGLAVARWRSRWMLGAALLDLVDPGYAETVRAKGRRLYADLMAAGKDVPPRGLPRTDIVRELAAHRARRIRPTARPLVPR